MRAHLRVWTAGIVATVGFSFGLTAAETPQRVAYAVDRSLQKEVTPTPQRAPQVNDQVFLRRAYLDLVGVVPKPGEITAFALDPASDKREKLVEKLLADPRFGQNWGRYFRDVIMYRKSEERALIVSNALQEYLTDEFNRNSPWSKIATDIITAKGDALEQGACGLIVAQQGQPEETAAEVSRIFLGVQIQCAQCHDHPWDRWKRDQFHELAAFFPRVSSRLILTPERRTVTVATIDLPIGEGLKFNNNRVRGTLEHYMSDLKNPEAKGKLMQPVLFATGDTLKTGVKDADRRGQLALWITKKDNPYFAQALVNRLWGELCGEGFYEPLDDLGPDRACAAPKTIAYLGEQFAESNYDIKWLFRTIMATEQYQLESRPRREPDAAAFQANVAQRLRSDVVLENLMSVLGFALPEQSGPMAPNRPNPRDPRALFQFVFGYDPSQRRDEISGSSLQTLVLMNGPQINTAINGRFGTELARVLQTVKDDAGVVEELYLKTLGREPTAAERKTCLSYVQQVNNRVEAFEDVQWTLINSTEFLHRK